MCRILSAIPLVWTLPEKLISRPEVTSCRKHGRNTVNSTETNVSFTVTLITPLKKLLIAHRRYTTRRSGNEVENERIHFKYCANQRAAKASWRQEARQGAIKLSSIPLIHLRIQTLLHMWKDVSGGRKRRRRRESRRALAQRPLRKSGDPCVAHSNSRLVVLTRCCYFHRFPFIFRQIVAR